MRFDIVHGHIRKIVCCDVVPEAPADICIVEIRIWEYTELSETSEREDPDDSVS
jgi:hypothetical protein